MIVFIGNFFFNVARSLIHSLYESHDVIEFLNRADDECKYAIVVTRDRERPVSHAGFPRNAEWSSFHENEGWLGWNGHANDRSFVSMGSNFLFHRVNFLMCRKLFEFRVQVRNLSTLVWRQPTAVSIGGVLWKAIVHKILTCAINCLQIYESTFNASSARFNLPKLDLMQQWSVHPC